MRKFTLSFGASFLFLVAGALLFLGIFSLANPSYSGQETFYTEEEYTVFKEAIDKQNARIEDLIVLSSNPPIIVKFTVSADKFPYGEKNKTENVLGFGLGTVFLGGAIYMSLEKSEAKENK